MLPLFVQTVLAILGVLCFGYAIKRVVKQKKIDCLLFLIGGLVAKITLRPMNLMTESQ